MKHVKLFEAFINESEIKIGTFVRYVKDDDFTGGKVVDIKGNKAEIRNWDGSTIYLPVKDLEYVPSWNESMIENFINEAKSKLFAALAKSYKLTEPNGSASMNGKYYQLEGDTEYDMIHFDYDPKSKKPFGVAQVAGHHMPTQILSKLGFRETRSWTAGVEVYIFDGNLNPTWLTEDQMSELVDGWSRGFESYAKVFGDFYKKRGRTSGTID